MLVTDVGDGFDRFCHQHSLSFNISVGYQHPKDATNIETTSLTPKLTNTQKLSPIQSHQHSLVANIHVTSITLHHCEPTTVPISTGAVSSTYPKNIDAYFEFRAKIEVFLI